MEQARVVWSPAEGTPCPVPVPRTGALQSLVKWAGDPIPLQHNNDPCYSRRMDACNRNLWPDFVLKRKRTNFWICPLTSVQTKASAFCTAWQCLSDICLALAPLCDFPKFYDYFHLTRRNFTFNSPSQLLCICHAPETSVPSLIPEYRRQPGSVVHVPVWHMDNALAGGIRAGSSHPPPLAGTSGPHALEAPVSCTCREPGKTDAVRGVAMMGGDSLTKTLH